ncbi:MAG: LicD family protein [Propionibacteriaceae bacterium]|jgi:lipopolysaccharide cholinephosphotransferase|nr:LicD family protein [Propionibacteriaceae bacterium]
MGLKAQLRRWLPLTGKATENYLLDLQARLIRLEEAMDRVEHTGTENLQRTNNVFIAKVAQDEMRFWSLYMREGETLFDAKRRFFAGLPEATGALRQAQVSHARLLAQFADVCEQNGLRYWLAYGTLLGAVRHQGFIPWDDDLDVQMPRQDFEALESILAEDPDHRLTRVFDRWVLCRQIRFRSSDPADHSFVDIFPVDVLWLPTGAALDFYVQRRTSLEEELRALPSPTRQVWEAEPYLDSASEGADIIEEIFTRHIREAIATDFPGPTSEYVMYGIDNQRFPRLIHAVHRCETIFPLGMAAFEGSAYTVPADADLNLRRAYGDYWSLPADITSHWKHVELLETDGD